ncbi:MAG TPA: ATP-binding protein [Lacunisphaera sp.]|nr:ATP-binding protein [Lacunisphaera sp.]
MKAWWRHRTLRFRLALWYGMGGTLLLTAFSATLYLFVAERMAAPLNEALQQDLAEIQQRLKIRGDNHLYWDGELIARGRGWNSEDPWFELWDEQGVLVSRLWPFARSRISRVPTAPTRGSDTLSVFRVAPDIRLRTFATPFKVPGHDQPWMIRVMAIHQPAADALGALLLIILVLLPIVVALLVAGGYFITRRWLKPLERMVAQAENITADSLASRLPVEDAEDELGRLAASFNRTLARLEDSFRTLDRFVADASHELRTPLTTLRSVGEVGLKRSRSVDEYREIIGSMLEEAQRLHQLVERLLELASAEGGAKEVRAERVRLDEFVGACVAELGILAENRNQQILIKAQECHALADPVLLRPALHNLIDNAMKYSPAGATIRLAVERAGAECRVAVIDEGPGVPPGQRAQLAERFYRVDDSRVRAEGGFGLGLAITKAYLRIMGGRLEVDAAPAGGSCFSLVLPAMVRAQPES